MVGDVAIGSDYPVRVQSMINEDTMDVENAYLAIKRLHDVGCEIVRLTVPSLAHAKAVAEKGFIIVGQDTDGTMTPIDLQMDWIVSKKKYDFIGKRSLYRSDTMREDRKQLVGLLTEEPGTVLEEGAQIVHDENKKPIEMIGHVTSSYFSPNLNRSIALAVVKNGKKLKGQKLLVPMENKTINVTVSDVIFYDKNNERLNA